MCPKQIKPRFRCIEMSIQETLHFISEVKLHSCLWDKTHEGYKIHTIRDKAWEALSISLGHNADDLVAKWNSLRSSARQLRSALRKKAKDGDPDALQVVKWPYYSAMSFANGDEPPTISLPTKLVPVISYQPPVLKRQPTSQAHNPLRLEGNVENHTTQILPKDETSDTLPSGLIKRRKVIKLSSQPNFKLIPTAAATSTTSINSLAQSSPNQPGTTMAPEFVAVKVEADSNPFPPFEQTFCEDEQSCSLRNAKDEDDVYGHSIALQIKQFSPQTKRKLQIQIQELISKTQKEVFEKDFGIAYDN